MSSGPSQTIALLIGTIVSFIFSNCTRDDRYLTMINLPGDILTASGKKQVMFREQNAGDSVKKESGQTLKIMGPFNGSD
jgi:hypothetical protein